MIDLDYYALSALIKNFNIWLAQDFQMVVLIFKIFYAFLKTFQIIQIMNETTI